MTLKNEKVKKDNNETFTEEQKRVIAHKKGNLLVSASAGSGKTRTMIERLIKLVSEGFTSIDKVLALTFTDASASDMKNKLRNALTDKINQGGHDFLLPEIDKVYYSDISTIDSFCNRLVKKYFFTAGVSPDFGIADDGVSELLKAEAMESTFREYYQKKDAKFLLLVDRYSFNRSDFGFRKVIESIFDHVDTEEDVSKLFLNTLDLYSKESFNRQLIDIKQRLDKKLNHALNLVTSALDGLFDLSYSEYDHVLLALKETIERLLNCQSVYEMKLVVLFDKKLDFRKKHPEEADFYFDKVKKAGAIVKEVVSKLSTYLTSQEEDERDLLSLKEDSEKIFEIVKRYREIYQEIKGEENLLDFSDVERCALKILQDESARTSILEDYEYVFIDEYQDVNGIQEKLINIISNDNLFMVGDVKQSIYGFRGCRPDYFEEKYREMRKTEGSTEKLNHNFRSAPKVIDAVNQVFCYSMTKDFYGSDYKGEAELKYGGLFGDFSGRARFDLLLKEKSKREKEEPRIYDIKEEIKKPDQGEVSNTLYLLSKIIEEEMRSFRYDVKSKAEVPVTYGDIAVLTRARSTNYVTDLIRGLSVMGIPVTSVAEENVGEYPEIKSLIAFFDLIVNIKDDVALLTVMKSPIGNFTEEELLEIVSFSSDKRKEKDYCLGYAVNEFVKNASGRVLEKTKEFLAYVDRIRYLSDFISAGEILDKVMDERSIEANILATSVSEQKLERIRFFRECCSKNGKNYSVKEISVAIKNNEKFLTRLSGGGDDSVKFVSMHSSKGLEFPVVIVLGTEKTLSDFDSGEQVLFDRELGFAVKGFSDEQRTAKQTPLRWLFSMRQKENVLKEELRLFYVALTRASSSLHITCVAGDDLRKDEFNGASKYVDFIPNTILTKIYSEEDASIFSGAKKEQVLIAEPKKKESEIKKNLEFVYPFSEDTVLPLKSTVTDLNKTKGEEYYSVPKMFPEETDGDAKIKGIVAHKILECYDFEKKLSARKTAEELIENGVLTEEQVLLVDLFKIDKAIHGGAFDGIEEYNLYREKSFLLSLPANQVMDTTSSEEILIQGQLDLLAVKEDKAVVIDYKYSKKTAERLKETYSKQLDIYAKAVTKILGVKVVEKYIVNILSGETVIID